MVIERIQRDGNLALLDFDETDKDDETRDRLYCIAYVDPEEEEEDHPLMLIWRRGKAIRSRSIGYHPEYGKGITDVMAFARLMAEAGELLRKDD